MKAVVTTRHGDRSVLQWREDYPAPSPRRGEAIVRVEAAAVNFHDIFTRRGMPGIKINLPVVVGSDIAGVVTTVGEGVGDELVGARVLIDPIFRTGDQVGMIGETTDGGRAEYVRAGAAQLIFIPDNVSCPAAAALPLAYGTAWRMMHTVGKVRSGERVLILGASGGVGAACVQIARLKGAAVIACASNARKMERLKELGVEHVVNYSDSSYFDAVRSIYGKPKLDGSGGVDVAVNFTGGDTMEETQRCVALGGRILTCGATAGYSLRVDARYWWTYEQQMLGSNGWSGDDLRTLLSLLSGGALQPIIDTSLPLEQAAEAERMLEDREAFGKIILTP